MSETSCQCLRAAVRNVSGPKLDRNAEQIIITSSIIAWGACPHSSPRPPEGQQRILRPRKAWISRRRSADTCHRRSLNTSRCIELTTRCIQKWCAQFGYYHVRNVIYYNNLLWQDCIGFRGHCSPTFLVDNAIAFSMHTTMFRIFVVK